MSHNVECIYCGYRFKTYMKHETKIRDHYYEDEITTYHPIEEENAYTSNQREYICSKCIDNIGEIIKNKIIKIGTDYINKINDKKQKIKLEYENKYKLLEQENNKILDIISNIKNFEDMTDEEIIKIKNKFPYFQERNNLDHFKRNIEKYKKENNII